MVVMRNVSRSTREPVPAATSTPAARAGHLDELLEPEAAVRVRLRRQHAALQYPARSICEPDRSAGGAGRGMGAVVALAAVAVPQNPLRRRFVVHEEHLVHHVRALL